MDNNSTEAEVTIYNETVAEIIIAYGFSAFFAMGVFLEMLCLILFFYHIVIKRTQYFCTAFFYILTIGFGFDLVSTALLLLGIFTAGESHHEIYLNIGIWLYWYSTMILGPWNTLMALNRFTAVWFWKRHDEIWNWKLIVGGIFGMFVYPFILSIHLLVRDSRCYFSPIDVEICGDITETASFIGTISNGIHVILAAFLGIITACSSKCKIISVTLETKKFEQFLLIQSFLSIILYGCHLFQSLTSATTDPNDDAVFRQIINNLSETYYTFFRISSALLLFFLSKTMRISFYNFFIKKFLFCSKKANVRRREDGSKMIITTRASITILKIT